MNFQFIILTTFIAPLLSSVIILIGGRNPFLRQFFSISGILTAFFATLLCLKENILFFDDIFYIDGFSILMQLMIEFVALLVVLYSDGYIKKLYYHRKEKFRFYYGFILLSTGLMNLTFVLNNLFFIYITLELSSIVAVYLIAFNNSKESLRAAFKYLLFVNVGIILSLLGIVLLFYYSGKSILLSNISENILLIPKTAALSCAALFIIGFFTKSAIMPFHLWLPDTYRESPCPITVFLTGAITKIGFYGIIRTVTPFAFHFEEIKYIVIFFSSITMILAALLAFYQKDIKNLIAYCSISEMGVVASAFALNSYIGIFGGIFHLINHTLMKGTLFFVAGILVYLFETTNIDNIKTFSIKTSAISFSFFAAALAVGGMPLFGSFLSSITIFFALANEEYLISSIMLIVSGFLSTVAILRAGISIFWQKKEDTKSVSIPFFMKAAAVLCIVLLIIFGLYPDIIYPLFDKAAKSIVLGFVKGG